MLNIKSVEVLLQYFTFITSISSEKDANIPLISTVFVFVGVLCLDSRHQLLNKDFVLEIGETTKKLQRNNIALINGKSSDVNIVICKMVKKIKVQICKG